MSHRARAWWLAAPLLAALLVLLAYPTAYALRLALTDPLSGRWPRLVNLVEIARDRSG